MQVGWDTITVMTDQQARCAQQAWVGGVLQHWGCADGCHLPRPAPSEDLQRQGQGWGLVGLGMQWWLPLAQGRPQAQASH